MSLRSQYVIGLYRDVNPTKNRCRLNIACPLGRKYPKIDIEEHEIQIFLLIFQHRIALTSEEEET